MKKLVSISLIVSFVFSTNAFAASIAYIHGRVANDGTVLAEGVGQPFDQMLITDSGDRGLSVFRQLVQAEGHSIDQFRDNGITLNSEFLNRYEVIIFGLHQKLWSASEKSALDRWLRSGGGMFIYSDSASGGSFRIVGAQNPVGQTATNNLIAQYGMQVTVDQADGTTAQVVNANTSISGINGLVLEGEGVSPIASARNDSNVEILVPYIRSRNPLIPHSQNITIADPVYASLALRPVEQGHIVAMFDRQPMWNNGPGSDIEEEDNRAILREVINFLALEPVIENPPDSIPRNNDAVITPSLLLLLEPN